MNWNDSVPSSVPRIDNPLNTESDRLTSQGDEAAESNRMPSLCSG